MRVNAYPEPENEFTVPKPFKVCGVVLHGSDRDHCDACLPEELRASGMAFREAGRAKLAALRSAGEDPVHSEAASRRRGEKVSQRQREFRQWDADHGGEGDPEMFRQEILPRLQGVSLGAMAKTTGLSEG